MAYTAHKDPEQVKERYDSEEQLYQKATELVKLIKASKYFISFTGAGVSTSAGIPDFRGPEGVWTLQATGGKRSAKTTPTLKALPTLSHMSIVELQKHNILKYLVSQNCDGLHRRSGVAPTHISELHGNSNIEQCIKCGKEYLRDFDASAAYQYSVHDHRTGRSCVLCGGILVDSIINFGENLPEDALQEAFEKAQMADLCLVLGSSLTVSPACDIPRTVGQKKKGNLVICNLQNTPLDKYASLRIYAKCDDLMKIVMEQLQIEVPPFILKRRVCAEVDASCNLKISAVDFDGTPASIFAGIIVNNQKLENEPFVINIKENNKEVNVRLFFFGHYNEPALDLNFPCIANTINYFDLSYNPQTGEWNAEAKGSNPEFIKIQSRPPRPNYLPADLQGAIQPANQPITASAQTGFSVNPKTDCPHIGTAAVGAPSMVLEAYRSNSCNGCKSGEENWMCLTCGGTFCSRYVKGHAADHYDKTKHSIAISFSDLSLWCYSCDDYITHRDLLPVVNGLHTCKFGQSIKK